MKNWLGWMVLGTVASCAGSGTGGGGTETGNPATLQHFAASECKTRAPEPGKQALSAASDLDGLQCVEWSRDASGVLTLRLSNFPEPCGDAYLGAAKLASDGALELSVYKDGCQIFKCGTCLYDFDFELAGIPTDAPLRLRTGVASCESEPVNWDDALQLPLDAQPSGLSCRYVRKNALEQYASVRGTCGERNMPCGTCAGTGGQTCAEGLSCSSVADGDQRCLAGCSADADCMSAMSCVDGLCQSQSSW
jgi:hypothetical protein